MAFAHLAASLALLGASQGIQPKLISGTLDDRIVPDDLMARVELKSSTDRNLPGVSSGDRVFTAWTSGFAAGDAARLRVALVETPEASFLFVDTNVDGELSESERIPYEPGTEYESARELTLQLSPSRPGARALPFRCRVHAEEWEGESRRYFVFTSVFRVEGYAQIGNRRTLVSLPFDPERGAVDMSSRLGIDTDGDGRVDVLGRRGTPEALVAGDGPLIFRVGDRYVSIASADFASRSFVLREHAASEYTRIELRVGSTLPDFDFVDFNERPRKLSDFRGKHLLIDIWGSWCPPCIADIPDMKKAYDRFATRGFEILGLDYEHDAPADRIRALLQEKGVSWPNAMPDSVRTLVDKRMRVSGFPTYILLDPTGLIVEMGSALRGQALIPTLEKHLKER
jgi:thiol-disulfide isomerase/thioredoxin